jgi:CHAT domain-containing protein
VYFSVHAVADARYPMNSYIELYAASDTNGKVLATPVYARQLLALDFSKTWLVILNACETASGKITRGEGVLNMVRIFSLAQVPVVVASLWKNDDRLSARIMNDFFTNLAAGEEPALALNHAKIKAIQSFKTAAEAPLPYFWAVFEVYKNGWDIHP